MLKNIIGIVFILFLNILTAFSQSIKGYKPFFGWGTLENTGENIIILRQWVRQGHLYYSFVWPSNLSTGVIRADSIKPMPATWETLFSKFTSSIYIKSLYLTEFNSIPLQDAGIKRFSPSQKGIDLTIDLCPSQNALDKVVFVDLIKELSKIESPVPFAVSVTGKWLNDHEEDFEWLDSLAKKKLVNIVWINHSYNHFVSKNAPLKQNFLLEPGTDINSEVLKTEIALMERGIIPSVFFRFPGLVSDKKIFDMIVKLGLIPVGSDAWLAKGQWPGNGSIVLIHANGNEPLGVYDFIKLLSREKDAVLLKKWELFDLRESLIQQEDKLQINK